MSRILQFHPPAGLMALLRYGLKHRRLPRLRSPVTFSDHIMRRMVFDRDPRLKIVCDKIAVKAFIAERVGEEHTVPLLGHWAKAADIPWDALPEKFFLKPNFLSGPFAVVGPESDRKVLAGAVDEWVMRPPALRHYGEWGYHGIPRRVMAEPLMESRDGGPLAEFGVHVFNGRASLIRLLTGTKLTAERRDAWFDPTGRQIELRTLKIQSIPFDLNDQVRRELIEVAETVAAGFQFMRVDCYDTPDGIRIGELSPYPWGGGAAWGTPETNRRMGTLFGKDADTSVFEDFHG